MTGALEIDDVSRRYGRRWALVHVSLSIAPAQSWMLLGHKPHLYDDLSAAENHSVWASLGGLEADIPGLLRRVGLDPARRDPVRTFSAGMRRRVALARMLLKRPELVLLDEPFTALDPAGRELLMDVIRSLRDDGATVIMATHLPQVAKAVAEHAVILDQGLVAYSGPVAALPSGLAFE